MKFIAEERKHCTFLCKEAKKGNENAIKVLKEEYRCKVYNSEEIRDYMSKNMSIMEV